MTNKMKITVLVGSLRKESFNKKIAQEFIRLAPESLDMKIVEIGNLPHYNQDLEENPPNEWIQFRSIIKASDGILIVSPEYNRTIPGVLKNAIDIATRPPKDNMLRRKPAAVASASGSGLGGFGANHNIRQAVAFSEVRVMPKEIYIGKMHTLFQEDGKTVVPSTEDFLKNILLEFEEWVHMFSTQ